MSSNHAFTKKLRASIKTKIQEYGIDADDELPDYVMVLAANRKEKHQMKSDLQLFLGKHTTSFVEWLFDAFDHIQNSEADSSKSASNKSTSLSDKKPDESKSSNPIEISDSDEGRKNEKRSPSVQSISPSPPHRLNSVVVVPERSKRDLSRERYRSREMPQKSYSRDDRYRRNDDSYDRSRSSRYRSNERPRRIERSPRREKPTVSSDSDEEKKKPHRTSFPKIHYDDSQKAGPSNRSPKIKDNVSSDDQKEDEVLMVGAETNEEKQNDAPTVTRFIIRVGDKEICRTIPIDDLPDLGSSKPAEEKVEKRKRLADDPARAVTKLMNAHDLKISPNLSARMERFGKENVKRAKLDNPRKSDELNKNDDEVEPYSPAPITSKEYDSEEEERIDQLLKSFVPSQTVTYQPSVIGLQYQQVPAFNQVEEMPRIAERCKFWPDCAKTQDECAYHHPNKLCVKFPNCSFGSQCLNVHPMCKFSDRCAKLNCPFTHHTKGKISAFYMPSDQSFRPKSSHIKSSSSFNDSSDRNSDSASSMSGAAPCKFGNRCAVTKCTYLHPKDCRYGMKCRDRKKNCPFMHRKPDLSHLQWTSSA